jgi:uncharacterized protein
MEPLYIPQLANRQDRTLEIVVDTTIPDFETLTPVRGKIIVKHGGTFLDVSAKTETMRSMSATVQPSTRVKCIGNHLAGC